MLNPQTFCAQAKPIQVVINGQPFLARPKQFKTGSFGWFLSGKVNASIGERMTLNERLDLGNERVVHRRTPMTKRANSQDNTP